MNAAQFFGVLNAMENNAAAEQRIYEEERRKATKPTAGGMLGKKLRELKELDAGERRQGNLLIRG